MISGLACDITPISCNLAISAQKRSLSLSVTLLPLCLTLQWWPPCVGENLFIKCYLSPFGEVILNVPSLIESIF